jgi:hypothetical protein
MKTLMVLLAAGLFSLAQGQAQEQSQTPKAGSAGVEVQTSKPKTPPQVRTPSSERGARRVESTVSYGGFLGDLAKSAQPVKTLDLRNPADPKTDGQNIHRDPVTGRPVGFVLFAIKF